MTFDHDFVARRVLPALDAVFRSRWFSFEVVGLEHVPRDRPALFVGNHAGWLPLDACVLGYAVAQALGPQRTPSVVAADAALALPGLGRLLARSGCLPSAAIRRPERLPPEIESVAMFPEGVRGKAKPFWQAYRMREWSRGFVRLAVARKARIVPVAVLGGEECLPVAWTVTALERVVGFAFGGPLVPLPLPARWKVVFHAPVDVAGRGKGALTDAAISTDVAQRVRSTVQATLDRESVHYPLGRLARRLARRRAAAAGEVPDPLLGP